VVLLNHENREVVFTVCGVLMNLMGDDEGRAVLRETDGVMSLVEVLTDAGSTDWQLAGMICKTLWNFSEGLSDKYTSAGDCFGEAAAEQLAEALAEMLDEAVVSENCDDTQYSLWHAEFLPVAQSLMERFDALAAA